MTQDTKLVRTTEPGTKKLEFRTLIYKEYYIRHGRWNKKLECRTLNHKEYYIRHGRLLEHWNVAALDQLPSFFVFASVHIRFFV